MSGGREDVLKPKLKGLMININTSADFKRRKSFCKPNVMQKYFDSWVL